MPAVSCRCCFPSFLYRVYQPTLRRAEASPRACVALCAFPRARGRAVRVIVNYGTAAIPSVPEIAASIRECDGYHEMSDCRCRQ